MEYIPKVVDVTLLYGDQTIATESFNIPLVISYGNYFDTKTQIITSIDGLTGLGVDSTQPFYKMVNGLYQGVGKPSTIVLGQQKVDLYTASFPATIEVGTVFSITLHQGNKNKQFTYTSVAADDGAKVATALKGLIDADTETFKDIFTTAIATDTLTFTPVVGKFGGVSASSNTSIVATVTETIENALDAIKEENDEWFYMICSSHVSDDILFLASYAETEGKHYMVSVQDADVFTNTAGNIGSQLQDLAYKNMTWAAKKDADTSFFEAGMLGAICGIDAGVTSLSLKTATGFIPDKLSETERSNVTSLNGNTYVKQQGVGIIMEGITPSGFATDHIVHSLYMKARTNETLFGKLYRESNKGRGVRFSQTDIDDLGSQIWTEVLTPEIRKSTILNEIDTVTSGGLTTTRDLRPTVTVPSRAALATDDINKGLLTPINVEYVYNSFIRHVKVNLTVLLNRDAVLS